MSSDTLVSPRQLTTTNDVVMDSAATIWATLSVLDEIVLEPGCRQRNQAAQKHLARNLDAVGLTKVELYEHIMSMVDQDVPPTTLE